MLAVTVFSKCAAVLVFQEDEEFLGFHCPTRFRLVCSLMSLLLVPVMAETTAVMRSLLMADACEVMFAAMRLISSKPGMLVGMVSDALCFLSSG